MKYGWIHVPPKKNGMIIHVISPVGIIYSRMYANNRWYDWRSTKESVLVYNKDNITIDAGKFVKVAEATAIREGLYHIHCDIGVKIKVTGTVEMGVEITRNGVSIARFIDKKICSNGESYIPFSCGMALTVPESGKIEARFYVGNAPEISPRPVLESVKGVLTLTYM